MTSDLVKRSAVLLLVGACLTGCTGLGSSVDEDDPEAEVPNLSMGRALMEGLGAVPSRQLPINYSPRAPLVVPKDPAAAALPQPEDPKAVTAQANWPKDPDVEARQALIAAEQKKQKREELNPGNRGGGETRIPPSELMAVRIPPSARATPPRWEDPADPMMPSELKKVPTEFTSSPNYDASGQPVRRALTDPPVDYLKPAPGAPVAIPEEPETGKKKGIFAWLPWN